MMTSKTMSVAVRNDAELVGESLAGNRDAFGQIVARYQSLVCSLAYSATGSLSQSEDLAQETFVAAWRLLAGLREPEKLRAWLCGIARNLIHNSLRKQGREPSHRAESLEEISEPHSSEPLPIEQTISHEEAAILWRSLERIPEIYREPLVLFYREHQSIETVAANLELSEDAVKQRLSRGRKMLHEQVLAFVEGALARTNPGQAFTLSVVAALPLLATTVPAAVGTATAQGGAAAKATGLIAFLQAILKIVVPIAPFVSLGGWLGYKMGRDAAGESQQRQSVTKFWSILTASLIIFVLLPLLLGVPLMFLFGSKENFLAGMRIWLDVMFGVFVAALALWIWQRRKSRGQVITESRDTGRKFFIWSVVLAMIAAGAILALGLSDSNWKVEKISTVEAQKIISERSQDAQFYVLRFPYHSAFRSYPGYSSELWIKLQENGKLSRFIAPADDATLALLSGRGIECPTYVQGRDFEIFGWQGKLLMGLFLFILAAGAAVLLTLSLKNKSKTPIMTTGTRIGIVAAVIMAALIVTPLVWLNHRKVNSVQPNQVAPQSLTPERAAQAKQTARDFLEALGKQDWEAAARLYPRALPKGRGFDDMFTKQLKGYLGGLEIVRLGTPYQKAPYPGVYVPYEIRFKSGETKSYNLAVRQDNPEQKWYWDGGL